MSVAFGSSIITISSFWTVFKATVSSKSLSMQYVDDGTITTVFAFDGPSLAYYTIMWDGGNVPLTVQSNYSVAQNNSDLSDFQTNFQPTANKPTGTNASVTTAGSTISSANVIGGLDTAGKLQIPQVGHRRLFVAGEPAGVMNEYLPGRAAGIAFEPSNWFSCLNAGGTISTSNWTTLATINSVGSQARLTSMASYAPSGSYGGQPVILEMDIDFGSVASGAIATWGFADAGAGAVRNAAGGASIFFQFVGAATSLTIGVAGTTTTVTLPSAGKHRYYIYWYTDKVIFYIDSPTVSVYEFDVQTANGHTVPNSGWIVCDITAGLGAVASFVCSQISASAAYPDKTGAKIIQPVSYASALYQNTSSHADRPSGTVSTSATTWTYIRASTFAAAAAATTFVLVSSSTSDAAAGVGARKVQVVYITSGGQRRHIVVTMNGTTNVTTTLPFVESAVTIEQMHVVSTGTTPNAVGNITATISATTVAVINAGDNRTLYAHRYIPDGSSLLITGITAASTVGAGQFRIVAVSNGGLTTGTVFPIQLTEPIRVGATGPSVRIQFDPPIMIGPNLLNANPYTYSNGDWAKMMAAVQWQADTVTANKAVAGFDCMEINP